MSGRLEQMRQAAAQIEISQEEDVVRILLDNGSERVIYTDGRDPILLDSGRFSESANWKKSRLVIKNETDRGGEVTESWSISEDELFLFQKIEMGGGGRMPKIEFTRVYDREETTETD